MEILKTMTIILLLIVLLLAVEKLKHMKESSIENLTQYLLDDILGFFKGVIKFIRKHMQKPKEYHWFEESLEISLKETVSENVATGFEVHCGIEVDNDKQNPARSIGIKFTANQVYSDEELNEMALLELKQLRNYLEARELAWKTFSTYNYYKNEVHIRLYFAEFPEEETFLLHRYNVKRKENLPQNGGVIIDELLDKELADVD